MSKLAQEVRKFLSMQDQMDELKTDLQSMEQRMVLLQPYIQRARQQLDIIREVLEEEDNA